MTVQLPTRKQKVELPLRTPLLSGCFNSFGLFDSLSLSLLAELEFILLVLLPV
jgi:hypothetical protein